jgi:vacuolar-type H+-ATPase subunit F/Vma7
VLITYGTAARIRDYLDGVILDPNGPLILEIPGVGDQPARGRVDSVVERVLGVH